MHTAFLIPCPEFRVARGKERIVQHTHFLIDTHDVYTL